jgi:hypothetical protein
MFSGSHEDGGMHLRQSILPAGALQPLSTIFIFLFVFLFLFLFFWHRRAGFFFWFSVHDMEGISVKTFFVFRHYFGFFLLE